MGRIARSGQPEERRYSVAERLRYSLAEERRLLLDAVSGLTEEQARLPLEPDGWSVHDILAHRLFWEGRESEALSQYLSGARVELLDFPVKRIDGTNAAAVDTLAGLPTERLLRGLRQTREALMELVVQLDDAALNAEGDAAQLVLGVALEHDREHRRQIQDWRRRRAQASVGDNQPRSPAAGLPPERQSDAR